MIRSLESIIRSLESMIRSLESITAIPTMCLSGMAGRRIRPSCASIVGGMRETRMCRHCA
jgi:hypothetical protein